MAFPHSRPLGTENIPSALQKSSFYPESQDNDYHIAKDTHVQTLIHGHGVRLVLCPFTGTWEQNSPRTEQPFTH